MLGAVVAVEQAAAPVQRPALALAAVQRQLLRTLRYQDRRVVTTKLEGAERFFGIVSLRVRT